jgi:hypothetical protein
MEAIQLPISQQQPDILVTDKHGKVVLILEAKAKKNPDNFIESAMQNLKLYLNGIESEINFAMLADLENIQIFKVIKKKDFQRIITLKTAKLLKCYDADFAREKIFDLYFITLLEAWLRDLAYHWKSIDPPGSEELAEIGLLKLIEGGDTYSQNHER